MWIAWGSELKRILTTGLYVWGWVFDAGGGKAVQGVIKHHNGVSLPRVKERQRRRGEGRGDERVSHLHVRERGRGGGDGKRKDQQSFMRSFTFCLFLSSLLHVSCYVPRVL